ncbi:MAG: hypothetical protein R3330_02950, partial [Saprospiraceae bacterium]|nr:hypothetical protein [Saprospiraceae bacterium]
CLHARGYRGHAWFSKGDHGKAWWSHESIRVEHRDKGGWATNLEGGRYWSRHRVRTHHGEILMVFDEVKATLSAPGSTPWCMVRPNRDYSVVLSNAAGAGVNLEFTPDGGTTVEPLDTLTELKGYTGRVGMLGRIRITAPGGHAVTTNIVIRAT